jgi:thioredoxin-dependent peroxiredoxin
MEALSPGQISPDFSLQDANGVNHQLAQYRGKWVILYFYPKDNTPGCTIEACQFRDNDQTLKALNAVVLGVSTDTITSHEKFIQRQSLPFTLLSDSDGKVSQSYGALFKLGPIKFSKRHTFIINPEGVIARIYRQVKPAKHGEEVIVAIKTAGRD